MESLSLHLHKTRRTSIISALAGTKLVVNAVDYCGQDAEDGAIWELDGSVTLGPQFTWTPRQPGNYLLRLRCNGWQIRELTVRVGVKPADLVKKQTELDHFFCLIAARHGRLIVHPIPPSDQPETDAEVAEPAADPSRAVFADLLASHTELYRDHFSLFRQLRVTEWPSGLYAVFPGTIVFAGVSRPVVAALREIERLANAPVGIGLNQSGFRAALEALDLEAFDFSTTDLFPDGNLGQSGRKQLGDVVAGAITDIAALAGQYGLELRGAGGTAMLIDLNPGRDILRLRMFDTAGATRQVESGLGGVLQGTGDIFDFSRGREPLFRSGWVPPGAKIGAPADGGSGIKAESGWERHTPSGWVPYDGNPRDKGDSGIFRHDDGNDHYTIYGKGEDTPKSGGADGGTDGGADVDKQIEEDLKFLEENTVPPAKDGGTGKLANDDGTYVPTADEIRWVIITRGGGLEAYVTEEGTFADSRPSDPEIPGSGLRDPVDPLFFYEWRPTIDELRLNPGWVDPDPEADGSGALFPFPAIGGTPSGVLGAGPKLSKTSTFHGSVLVEEFQGVDALGRQTNGSFGAVSVVPMRP